MHVSASLAPLETGAAVHQHTQSPHPPRALSVLGILLSAGDVGMLAPEISRMFTYVDMQRCNSRVNQILNTLAHSRRVHRASEPEASQRYHNTPCFRWFITPLGKEYFESGGRSGELARSEEQRIAAVNQRLQRVKQRELIIATLPALIAVLPPCVNARREFISRLRQNGLTLDEIAVPFHVTRERVRQWERGINVRPCKCSTCVYGTGN